MTICPKTQFYGNKQNAQEAHEAIRPSHVLVKSSQLTGMERDAQRLYELIWRQFVACQMMPARYQSVNLMVAAGDIELKAKGRTLVLMAIQRCSRLLRLMISYCPLLKWVKSCL